MRMVAGITGAFEIISKNAMIPAMEVDDGQ